MARVRGCLGLVTRISVQIVCVAVFKNRGFSSKEMLDKDAVFFVIGLVREM